MQLLFEKPKPQYAQVWVPFHVSGSFTYEIPNNLGKQLLPGCRVVVPFGNKRIYTALVIGISTSLPQGLSAIKVKPIDDVLDSYPLFSETQLRFMQWIADYYIAYPGDLLQFALPAALKMASETFVTLHPDAQIDETKLTDDAYLVYEALTINPSLKVTEIISLFSSRQKALNVLSKMVQQQLLAASEVIIKKYKEKQAVFIGLAPTHQEQTKLAQLLNELEKNRAHKQVDLLLWYLHLQPDWGFISREKLLADTGFSTANIKQLVDKQIFVTENRAQSRLQQYGSKTEPVPELSHAQQIAFNEIMNGFTKHSVVLLHGVTGSGKTNIYAHLISASLRKGQQVLILVPEIALTTQLVIRFRQWFGNQIGVYHSKFNENERVEIFLKVQNNSYDIVLGPRSALFLPFSKLGLIIVDEEHEPSFKQSDASPRYHGRDAAIAYGSMLKAKVLLGSATPSVETYYLAQHGKYGLVKLQERYGQVPMPSIHIADIGLAHRERTLIAQMFTPEMYAALEERSQNKKQLILFLNRRGYTSNVVCRVCGNEPECPNCDIKLTYHKLQGQLRCHYCNYTIAFWAECPACKSNDIGTEGLGTQKVEETMHTLFPTMPLQRVDADTTRAKDAFAQIIAQFERQKTQALIGTQMVTKGLDFEHVTLVGVVAADQSLAQPDFRARERAFQLFLQVAGRAGRRGETGEVVIQTRRPLDPLFDFVKNNDYQGFFNDALKDRLQFQYPPFTRIIRLELKHQKAQLAHLAASELVKRLQVHLPKRVLGPSTPAVGRINNFYIEHVLIKIERNLPNLAGIKEFISKSTTEIAQAEAFKGLLLYIDVDPV